MTLEEIEGYVELGFWQYAWDAIQLLPEDVKGARSVRLRLRCCAPLGAWELGSGLAQLMNAGEMLDRREAAQFWLAMARHDIEDPETAQACVIAAIKAWPDCRQEVLDDPVLSRVVFRHLARISVDAGPFQSFLWERPQKAGFERGLSRLRGRIAGFGCCTFLPQYPNYRGCHNPHSTPSTLPNGGRHAPDAPSSAGRPSVSPTG